MKKNKDKAKKPANTGSVNKKNRDDSTFIGTDESDSVYLGDVVAYGEEQDVDDL